MFDVIKKSIQNLVRRSGYEIRKYNVNVQPEERTITLGQLASLDFGEITIEEARFLGDLVRGASPDGPIIEIGTLFGWSTKVLAMAKSVGQPLITVDKYIWNPWGLTPEEHQWLANRLLSDASCKLNVEQVVMDKNEYYATYSGERPAFVFMDAVHDYEETRSDIQFAKRVDAGIICGHDYDVTDFPGVVKAVDEFGGPAKRVGSLWVL